MKTVTLETARKLSQTFKEAGIEVPETEHHHANIGEDFGIWHRAALNLADINGQKYTSYPAPDAHELGEWLPEIFVVAKIGKLKGEFRIKKHGGKYGALYEHPQRNLRQSSDWEPTMAEALAALLIACLKADPEQIRNHMQNK